MIRRSISLDSTPRIASDLRGLGRLVFDGVRGVTDVVEAVHAAVGHLPAVLGRPAPVTTTGLTRFVYRSVRGVTRLVGDGVDLSLSTLAPVLGSSDRSPQREALVAAINGVLGDHLEASGNPLAIRMQLRRDGNALTLTRKQLIAQLPRAGGKVLVQVHGLCMNDLQWNHAGHDHGEALARDLGYTPVHLHYNSGRHISTNGRELAGLLEQLIATWPVPVEEITLLCHSMGGLVARSALDVALREQSAWSKLPIRVVFLGTPHHGAPLERAGSWADLLIGISPYSAPFVTLGKVRSAGIQDLRHGNVRDSDWQERVGNARADGRTPMPLPEQVRAYAIAVTTQPARKVGDNGSLPGDGLVPIASAFGAHADRAFDLGIPRSRRWLGHGIHHLEMLGSDAVYQRIARWLRG
ncbi:esterase/lipase family protein [Lysobacter niabensis]|uniref:esterase/lipase family protein n=1 Tax=Agrilutibacter niabensis TaxID=380628 RepID=UPI00361F37D9